MFIHSVVFIVLSILSGAAAYASSMPISKEPREQAAADLDEDTIDNA